MIIKLSGVPISQGRMRIARRGAFSHLYDPNAKDKQEVRALLEEYRLKEDAFLYPEISFLFIFPIGKRWSKIRVQNNEVLPEFHDKKPDVDNLVKFYLDCLDGIVIHGDQKVCLGECLKIYGSSPQTQIWIREKGEGTLKFRGWPIQCALAA